MSDRVPPLNLTADERGTLLHCIISGKKEAIEHFGEEEAERIGSIENKLNYRVGSEVSADE